ncbi:MAG TPA: DeoR/GlpR family DNA-binding transcription regulator [Jatrophihabitans sp.]|nr:DeoR/GlpR family DNA-binding transcription regulator [Jatrophihabitans sp.]
MLADQRQARIMDELRRKGGARITDLVDILGVSDMTVRRDLTRLETRGAVQKVHGGAVLSATASAEPGFEAKSSLEQPAKTAIAAAAAQLIRPGSAIALSAGTTTWALAQHVGVIPGLTIVTNSTAVADLIANSGPRHDQTVILTGGIRTPSAALVGPVADQAIRNLHVDQLFLGVHGMDAATGFTTPNLAEAETNRALIAAADQVVICADATKWGTRGLASFAPLSAADILITDDSLSDDAHAVLADQIDSIMVVSSDGHGQVERARR